MIEWFMTAVGHLPDVLILLAGAVTLALIAMMVAALSRRLLFANGSGENDRHAKLAEIVHGSLLAFTVFVLALVLNDVRGNLGRADDATLREAATMTRLDLELKFAKVPESAAARQALRSYASAVVVYDWPSLGTYNPSLSAQSENALLDLIEAVDRVTLVAPRSASALKSHLDKLQDLRQGRLETATKSVARVLWWTIAAFLLGAMIMNGRHPVDLASLGLISLHIGAIGLVIALILVMDEPFRGQTSILPDPITKAFETSAAP
jgi:hypothetical protein